MSTMVSDVNSAGFDRVTLWSHPFVNLDSQFAAKLVDENHTAYVVQVSAAALDADVPRRTRGMRRRTCIGATHRRRRGSWT